MQALDRTQPGLPLKKGRCGTLTHDYKRNGDDHDVRRAQYAGRLDYRDLYRRIVIRNSSGFSIRSNVPCRKTNRSISRQLRHAQTSESRQLVHEAQHGFHVHFTPTSASWLNMVTASSRIFPNNGFGAGFSIRFLSPIRAVEELSGVTIRTRSPSFGPQRLPISLEKVQRARKKLDKLQSV